MGERRTAIGCPEHSNCVCILLTVPETELGDRKRVKVPYRLDTWLQAQAGQAALIQVEHIRSELEADSLLIGDVVVAPKDIGDRMRAVEKRLAGHEPRLFATEQIAEQASGNASGAHLELLRLRQLLYDMQDGYVTLLRQESERTGRLEAFVTRRKRWRKTWEKWERSG